MNMAVCGGLLWCIKTITREKPACLCCIKPAFLRSLLGFPLGRVTACHVAD